MASSLSKYSLINAKLRARISNIVPDEVFHRLAAAPSLEAALALLRDTPFAGLEETYSSTGDLRMAELDLLKTEIELYKNIKGYLHSDSTELVEALLSRFEIDNLKNAIRVFFDRKIRKRQGSSSSMHYILYEPILHKIPIDIVVNAETFDEIAEACEGTPYRRTIKTYSRIAESENSLFRMEVELDHLYYNNLLAAIDKLSRRDRSIALRLAGVEIDLQNIDWIIRFKHFYNLPLESVLAAIVPGGFNLDRTTITELYSAPNVASALQGFVSSRYPGLPTFVSSKASDATSRLLLIQQILNEIMENEVRRILAGYPFTIGIVLAYFILKRSELRKIRIILNTKQYGIPQERIESMI